MSEETPAQKLLAALVSSDPLAVANLLFQVETYFLNASLQAGGLMAKHPKVSRDIFAHKQMLDEAALWARSLHTPLYERLGIAVPKSPSEPASAFH